MNLLVVALVGHVVIVNEFNKLFGIDIEIGSKNLVAVAHMLRGIAALDGNGNLLCLVIGYFCRFGYQSDKLAFFKIGRHIFQTGVSDAEQIHCAYAFQLCHYFCENLALAFGTSEVGINLSDSRVIERLGAIHVIGAFALAESGEKTVHLVAAHIPGFGCGNCDFYSALSVDLANLVDNGLERVEVNDDILVHCDAQIGLNGLFEQLDAADGIGGIELGAVFSGNLDVKVSQKGSHFELFVLAVYGEHHHGVASSVFFHVSAVAAYEQDVFNIRIKKNRGIGQFDLCVIHAFHFSGSLRVRFGVECRAVAALLYACAVDEIHAVEQGAYSHTDRHEKCDKQAKRCDGSFLPHLHRFAVAGFLLPSGTACFGNVRFARKLGNIILHIADHRAVFALFLLALDSGRSVAAVLVTLFKIPFALLFAFCRLAY